MGPNPTHNQFCTEILPELIKRLAEGDSIAIDRLYRYFYPRLRAFGLQVAGYAKQDEVKDSIQEVFLWLAQNYAKVDRIQHFEAYLFQSVRRNVLSRLKAETTSGINHYRFSQHAANFEENIFPSAEYTTIEKEISDESKEKILIAIEQLPDYLKEIIYLRFYQEMPYKEIGKILSISEQVARNYALRAIKRLREKFQILPKIKNPTFF